MRYDRDGRVVYLSPQAEGITGVSVERFLGRTNREAGMPEDLCQLWEAAIARVFATGAAESLEFAFPTVEGERIFLLKLVPEPDADGDTVRHVLGISTDITEQKRSKLELRESKTRLRMAWQATREVIWDWDIEQDAQRWNAAGIATFGWTDAVDAPQTAAWWSERVHADDRTRVAEGFRRALEDPAITRWEDEYRFLRGDGRVANVIDRGFILRDAAGKPTRMIGAMQDVTECRRAEDALHRGEQRYRTLVDATSTITWTCPPTGLQTEPQLSWMAFTGQTAGEMLGTGWTDAVHLDDRAVAARRWTDAIAREEPFVSEHRIRRHDGEWRWMRVQATPIRAADGQIVEWIGMNLDITERKLAETALRQALAKAEAGERMLATLLANVPEGITICDAGGTILTVSQEGQDLLGGPHVGKTVEAVVRDWTVYRADGRTVLPTPELPLRRALAGETIRDMAMVQVNAAGRRLPLLCNAAPIRDDGGDVVGAIVAWRDISERQRATEALEAERARLQAVLDALPVAVWIADENGTVMQSNRAVDQVWGKTQPPFGLERYADFQGWWADTGAPLKPEDWALARAVRQGEVSTGEVIDIQRFSGARGTILNSAAPVVNKEGRIIGGVAAAQDITAWRHAEKALERKRALLQAIFDTIPVLLVLWNPRLDRFTLNRHAERVLGWSSAEANTGDFMARIYPDPSDRAEVNAFMQSLESGFREYPITTKLGERVPIEWANARLRDELAIGIGVDLRERKAAEAALLRSREGLSRLAEASLAVMAQTDLQGMLRTIAEAALALTGARHAICAHGEVGGPSVLEHMARAPEVADGPPPACLGAMFQPDRGGIHLALTEGAESLRLTDRALRTHPRWWGLPAGHLPLHGLLGVSLRARGGSPNGMILVTDSARGDFSAEDEALLRQFGTVAALALQHIESRLALEEADRRKDHFLAMLGHELRNPLAPIRNSLAILEHVMPDGDLVRRAHAVIDRQVTHLTRLVDDLLDVTRIRSGKIELKRELIELGGLVRCTLEDYRETFARGQLALELALPEEALWVSADRTRLVQVIGNLLANAAKFTPPGGQVAVSLKAEPQGEQALLRVRDTGVGIAPEMLSRVFEPFIQADIRLERGRGGLGLGLAAVKGLIERHGGRVEVTSAGLGAGTELTVRLPLERGEPPVVTPADRRAAEGARRHVLIIEDNRDAAESLRLLLELLGHRVEHARTGPEGVAKARALGPDLILCDIGLPGMDGYAVARTLRQDPRPRTCKLVALSGYAAPEDVARAQEAGFDAHLAKPLELKTLEALLLSG